MYFRWMVLVGLLLGGLHCGECGAAQTPARCAATCTGCCTPDGACESGTAVDACGASGRQCLACGPTDACSYGLCLTTSDGGAGGGSGGTADAGFDAGIDAGPIDAGPLTLLGIKPNEVWELDPESGASTLLAALPDSTYPYFQVNTNDPVTKQAYLIASPTTNWTPQLFTVDEVTAAHQVVTLVSANGGGPFDWGGGIYVRSNHTLVGLTWNYDNDAGAEELRSIDPATGQTNVLADLPGVQYSAYGTHAIDPARDRLYIRLFSQGAARLFTIDAMTGAVVASPSMTVVYQALHVRADGVLVGLRLGSQAGLERIDPATGSSTQLGPLPGDWYFSGASTLDPVTGRIFAVFNDTAGRGYLATIDAYTGERLVTATVSSGDAGSWWYGGLHAVRR